MHPYRGLGPSAFWSKSVAQGYEPSALLSPEVVLIRPGERVASAGSCFAANLVPYLEQQGFEYVRTEARHPVLREIPGENLGYDRFSAAYGNLYTTRQLLQLLRRCLGRFQPEEDRWLTPEGVIDPFRPGLEYHASSEREFDLLQAQHLAAVRRAFQLADVFVFTLGLTEAWVSARDGAVFPACPGTVKGTFDAARHVFVNFDANEVASDLSTFVHELRAENPRVRLVLTVSPVPLIATASGAHVLVASTYSKAVLRVAADQLARSHADTVYFPAYEIVTGPQAPEDFFEPDKRSVSKRAIDTVMAAFLAHCQGAAVGATSSSTNEARSAAHTLAVGELSRRIAEAECEEAMVEDGWTEDK